MDWLAIIHEATTGDAGTLPEMVPSHEAGSRIKDALGATVFASFSCVNHEKMECLEMNGRFVQWFFVYIAAVCRQPPYLYLFAVMPPSSSPSTPMSDATTLVLGEVRSPKPMQGRSSTIPAEGLPTSPLAETSSNLLLATPKTPMKAKTRQESPNSPPKAGKLVAKKNRDAKAENFVKKTGKPAGMKKSAKSVMKALKQPATMEIMETVMKVAKRPAAVKSVMKVAKPPAMKQ